jgi:hypothetical protein
MTWRIFVKQQVDELRDLLINGDLGLVLCDDQVLLLGSSETSNAKNVRWPNEIWAKRSSADVGKLSQGFRSLVLWRVR